MTDDLPFAREVRRDAGPTDATLTLDYEGRLLRRRKLTTDAGWSFVADLARVVSLADGDALVLEDGRSVGVAAAPEDVLEVQGDLPRLAWHIGNRHAPCEVKADRLVIRRDPVLARMLEGLGARLSDAQAPFRPEGGAYGHGRTQGHSHG